MYILDNNNELLLLSLKLLMNNNKLTKLLLSNKDNQLDYELYSATDLLGNDIDEIPFLIENLFPKISIVAFAGSSDVGKSTFLRQLALTVSTGQSDFLGFKTNIIHKRVLYISTEDDHLSTSAIIKKQKGNNPLLNKLKLEDFKGLNFLFDSDNLLKIIKNRLEENSLDLIIIDAFTDIFGEELNSSNKVRTFLNEYYNLIKKHNCLLIFLHHTNKKAETLAPSKNNLLGSQGFEAKMRLVIELRSDKLNNEIKHLCIVKGNYLKDEYKTKSVALKFKDFVFTREKKMDKDFENLVNTNKSEYRKKINKTIIDLHFNKGMAINKIPAKLNSMGFNKFASNGTVEKVIKQYKIDNNII